MPPTKLHLKRRRLRAVSLAAAVTCLILAGGAQAQIATDSSLGMAAQTLSGPAYAIPQSLGKLSGSNLFHSFQRFNIGSGESATFSTATPGVSNVISRVTGGSMSQINGLLRLTAIDGTPGFFFINPAGVTFGAGAAIDVPGAFHVGTADYLAFPDGRFHADLQQASSFSSAAPQAFGFLGSNRSAINVIDGAEVIQPRGPAVGLTAGDILIDNATVGAGAGSTRIIAVGSQAAEIGFDGALPVVGGDLSLSRRAAVISVARGDSDGASVALHGGRIEINGEALVLSVVGEGSSGNGGAVDVVARDVLLMSSGGSISSDTAGAGNAGAIRIRTGEAALESGAYLYSSSGPASSGSSGAIDLVSERSLLLSSGASISTATGGSGVGAGITLQAGSMRVDDRAYVQIDAHSVSAPGSLVLDVAGELAMTNSARIVTGTSGVANGGAVDLRLGRLTMDSQSFVGSLSLPGASGASGLVDIRVNGDASLSGGASLLASSASAGNAAPIRVRAANLRLDNSAISSNATDETGAGASGSVELVLSGDLTLGNASLIDTSTLSGGNAGTIVVRARDISLNGDSRMASRALAGSGSAGAVDLLASGRLLLRGESSLSTSTSTTGNAGEIKLKANSVLIETGGRVNSIAGLDSTGEGGNISITADGELQLRSDAGIGANTAGPGNAGNIRLVGGSVLLDGPAFVTTSTTAASTGQAGRIEVASAGDLKLRNNAFISSDTQGGGNAGQVDLQAASVTMEGGARISSATGPGSSGNAGLINLVASGDVQMINSSGLVNQSPQISTSTQASGSGGEFRIRAANLLIDGEGAGVVGFAQAGSAGVPAASWCRSAAICRFEAGVCHRPPTGLALPGAFRCRPIAC